MNCPWDWCDAGEENCPHMAEPAMGTNVLVDTPEGGVQRAIYLGRLKDRYGVSVIVDVFDEERFLRSMHPSRMKPFDPKKFHQKK